MPAPFISIRRHRGFSLPEIMVGMIIGMLGIIIIMQVTSVFESQKRTTTSGDDAQNSGAIALYSMQRDLSQAGYGFSSANLVGREFRTPYITFAALTPVVVNPAQLNLVRDAETDTFIVIYGNSNSTTEGAIITNSNPTPYTITGGAGASDGSNAAVGGHSFLSGDWVTVDDGAASAGSSVTATHYLYAASGVDVGAVPVTIPGAITQAYVAPPVGLQDTAAGPHPVLYNFGPSPSILAYAVRNGSLSVCNYLIQDCASNTATWLQLTGGIVSMRVQCSGAAALRVALVARSTQINPAAVTTTTPIWNPNGASAAVAATPATSWGADWNQYRYKTFETIVPIRNAIWTGVQGC